MQVFIGLLLVDDAVGRRQQAGEVDDRRNARGRRGKEIAAAHVLEAKRAEPGFVVDQGQEVDGQQRPRLTALRAGA